MARIFLYLTGILGLTVIAGWYLNIHILIQLHPELVPMQYNTALCFFLSAFSLILEDKKYRILSKVVASIVLAIGLATIIQYVFNLDFGIDEYFITHYITQETSHPGRMAPNTALCFFLVGINIIALSISNTKIQRLGIIASISILSLSCTSFIGYVMGQSSAYGWGQLTRMALHTCVGFIFISIFLINNGVKELLADERYGLFWFPIYTFIFGFLLVSLLYDSSLKTYENNFLQAKNKEIKSIEEKINLEIMHDLNAIERLASRRSNNITTDEQVIWDVKSYMRDMQEIKSFVDISSSTAKAIYPNDSRLIGKWNYKCESDNYIKLQSNTNVFVAEEDILCVKDGAKSVGVIIDIKILLKKHISSTITNTKGLGVDIEPTGRGGCIEFFNKIFYVENLVDDAYEVYVKSKSLALIIYILGVFLLLAISMFARSWIKSKYVSLHLGLTLSAKKESEDSLLSVVQASDDSILIVNRDGKIIFANNKAISLMGASHDMVLDQKIEKFVPESIKNEHVNFRERYTTSPKPRPMNNNLNISLVKLDGESVPVSISLSPIIFKGQKVIMCSMVDQTYNINYKKKIERDAENIKIIYDLSCAAARARNKTEVYEQSLSILCASFGFPVGHVYLYSIKEGKPILHPSLIWFEINPESTQEFRKITMETQFRLGEGLPGRIWATKAPAWIKNIHEDSNFPRVKKCQDIKINSAVAFPVVVKGEVDAILEFFMFESKESDTQVLQTFQIIGEQLGRELERKLNEDSLKQEEEKNRLLLSSAGEGIFGIDLNGNTTFINPAALNMLGYNEIDIVGKNQHNLIHHSYPDNSHYPKEKSPIYAAFKDGSKHRVDTEVFWRKGGDSFPVEYLSQPMFDSNGNIIGAVVTFNDITERKVLEEDLIKQQTHLKELNVELEAFSFSISHDLKAPLRHISSFIQMLDENLNGEVDVESKRYIDIIKSSSSKMRNLIDALLEFSNLSKKELNKIFFDMNEIVEEVCNIYNENKEVNIEIQVASLARAYADPNLIKMVWINLLGNAIKFSADNKTSKISIWSSRENNRYTAYYIRDNGVGFDGTYADSIFDVFKRLHDESEFEGSGIGLANVAKIITRHGGEVNAVSKVGVGATFSFTLPDKE